MSLYQSDKKQREIFVIKLVNMNQKLILTKKIDKKNIFDNYF